MSVSVASAGSPAIHRIVHLKQLLNARSLVQQNGSYTGAAYQNALRQRAAMIKQAASSQGVAPAVIGWSEIGPDNVGGRINSLWADPRNLSHILAASASGGLWQSNDGGSTWAAVSGFPGSLATSALAELPDGTLLAGTGDFNTAGGDGIMSSTDGGNSWLPLASTTPSASALHWAFVNSLAVSSNGVILAATGISGVPGGIERSTDNGQTWASVWPATGTSGGSSSSSSMDVAFDPENANAALADDQYGGAVFSTDAGKTWSEGTGLPGTKGARVSVAFDPSVSGSAYALVDNNGGSGSSKSPSGQVYHSADGGKTWTLLADTTAFVNELTGTPGGALCDDVAGSNCQGWYDNVIIVLPHSAATSPTILAGGIDIFTSTDGGSTWTETGDWLNGQADYLHADQHAFTYDPTDGLLLVGNDGGFYRQVSANTWSERNQGLADTQFYSVSGHADTPSSQNLVGGVPVTPIVGGAQDNGSLLYEGYSSGASPQPNDWVPMEGGDGGIVLVDPADGNDIFGEAENMLVYYSLQGGMNAQAFNPEPADSGSGTNFVAPLALVPNGSSAATQMLVGGASLWFGNNITGGTPGSTTWSAISASNMPSSGANGNYISAVGTDPANGNDVWVGYNDGEVYNSENALSGSPTWSRISSTNLPSALPVSSFWVVPGAPSTVYVTFRGVNSSGGNVFASTDGGATWAGIGAKLPAESVYSLLTHPADPQVLYVGTLTGVYTSSDGGQTWLTSNVGPANVMVRQLTWFDSSSPDHPTLLAATFGRGAWMGSPAYNSTPDLTSVSPSTVLVGSPATTITITGTGFVQGVTTATVKGGPLGLTYVSSTQLQATLSSDLLAGTGTLTVQLANPAPGGGTSSGASVTVENPAPVLTTISPSSVEAGASATTITVSGSSFEPNSVVDWNGTALTTTYQSASSLSAAIPATDLSSATSATVTVVTPGPGGGTSSGDAFTVTAPPHSGGGGAFGDIMLALLMTANLILHGPRAIRRKIPLRRTTP